MPQLAPSMDDTKLTWAHWWVSQGWSVFPLHPREKEPATKNGFKDATQDEAQIDLWWTRNADYNIGGVPPEDHLVVDIDGPSDIDWPMTWEHKTRNGRHLTFKCNPVNPIPQGQKVWPHVDTRLNGKGYIVLPPSVHPDGGVYSISRHIPIRMFPSDIKPAKVPGAKKTAVAKKEAGDDIVTALRFEGIDGQGRDDTMIRIAGYLARYVPSKEVFCNMLAAINKGWVDPLDDAAMDKKFMLWDRHQETLEAKEAKEIEDEARGWLYEAGGTGYSSRIERRDGSFDVVEFSDFRVQARGLVIEEDRRTFIVDFTRADGTTLEGAMLDTTTLSVAGKLKTWLANRGMVLHTHRGDVRGEPGLRLQKLLQSQEPPELKATDYYGFNPDSHTFITDDGEITLDGERRRYTDVFPIQNLNHDGTVHYGFEFEPETVLDLFRRTLGLNKPLEMAKLGAWVVMTLLRGQYAGNLPGIMTSAFSGTGKSTLYEIITGWLGFPQHGGKMTVAVFRDFLSRSANAAVWLDDFTITDEHSSTIRAALTTGQETKMELGPDGKYRSRSFALRGTIILSDEGNAMKKEKANRDRMLEINLETGYRTTDGEALKAADVSKGAGTLVSLLFKHRGRLDDLPVLLSGAVDRPSRWRVLLTVGARILSDLLEDESWYTLVKEWSEAIDNTRNQASILVHDILPWAWGKAQHVRGWGQDNTHTTIYNPVWYDEDEETFWVNVNLVSERWLERSHLTTRQRQLGTAEAIRTELRACGASGKGKTFGVRKLRYAQLPVAYSAIVKELCEIDTPDEDD